METGLALVADDLTLRVVLPAALPASTALHTHNSHECRHSWGNVLRGHGTVGTTYRNLVGASLRVLRIRILGSGSLPVLFVKIKGVQYGTT